VRVTEHFASDQNRIRFATLNDFVRKLRFCDEPHGGHRHFRVLFDVHGKGNLVTRTNRNLDARDISAGGDIGEVGAALAMSTCWIPVIGTAFAIMAAVWTWALPWWIAVAMYLGPRLALVVGVRAYLRRQAVHAQNDRRAS
jgi:hypothetical protein